MSSQQKQLKPLTGQLLLKQVQQLSHLNREEKAKACGYISIEKDGSERIKTIAFMNALLEAEGIDLDHPSSNRDGKVGRTATYRVSVQANGNVLLGSAYTEAMGVKPGDKFKISLSGNEIHLNRVA